MQKTQFHFEAKCRAHFEHTEGEKTSKLDSVKLMLGDCSDDEMLHDKNGLPNKQGRQYLLVGFILGLSAAIRTMVHNGDGDVEELRRYAIDEINRSLDAETKVQEGRW